MKKIVKISLILFSIMCIVTAVYAASCNISLKTEKDEFSKDEEFVVDVNMSNIQSEPGIIIFGATLEYDKNNLTLVKMEGKNTWATPSYNEENGTFVVDRGAPNKSDETIFSMTFKVKSQEAKTSTITLKNVEASDGDGDIKISNATKTITLKSETPTTKPEDNNNNTNNNNTNNNNTNNNNTNNNNTNNNNTNNNNTNNNNTNNNNTNNSNNNNNKNNNTNNNSNTNKNRNIVANTSNNKNEADSMKTGTLPKAGATNIILVVLGILVALGVFFYIRIKALDKTMKSK